MRKLFLTIAFLYGLIGIAQNLYPPVVNYSTKDYGKDRNPENYAIVQDQRGVMYFGTSHGVLEFDGENWAFIQVGVGSFVRSLAVDSANTIYCGAYGDFGVLKPNQKGALAFQSLLPKVPEEDQFFSNVWNIHLNQQGVFFQTEVALYQYKPNQDTVNVIYPETSFHTSFMVNGELFLRQREVGLVKFTKQEKIAPLKGTEAFANYGVFGLHQLADDSLLIITQELGIFKWAHDSLRKLPEKKTQQSLTSLGVFGSTQLSDGNFALNTFGNGAIIINDQAEIVQTLDRKVGIRSNVVQKIYQDRDLNLWMALENGIAKVNYHSPLSYFDEKTGIEGNVQAVIRFKEKIYVGTSYGLYVQDNTGIGARQFRNTKAVNDQVWDFCQTHNSLYIATANGIYKTQTGDYFEQINFEKINVLIYRDSTNDFIGGGAQGITVYDQNFKIKWNHTGYFSRFLGAAVDPTDHQTIWLGTTKSGVYRLKENQSGAFTVDQYGDFDGLLEDMGKPIVYQDSLIFGAKNGLFYFVNEDKMKEELKSQLTKEQLQDPDFYKGIFERYSFHDSIFHGQFLLMADDKARTWYCNEFKIGFYDKKEEVFKNRPFWGINYGRINHFYLENDGVLWIGATEGLIRFEENNYKNYNADFYALIRSARLIKGEVLFNGVFTNPDGQISKNQHTSAVPEIDYRKNDIEFVFSAPYFEDEHEPQYRYILEGYDESWSDWKTKSDVSYNNLHEGDYIFKVEARNIYGQISRPGVYAFTILSPWYRTTWAYALYFLLFILIFFIGVKISSKRLKDKNQWLETVIEERTKEISQKNTILEHQKQEIEDSISYAQRIQEAILPLETEMKKWLPHSFVLFRPKDIVSGDFYWFLEKDKKLVFICADCTGHGVPGAFMSMIGSDRLNNIVSEKKITSPGLILSELNRAIKKSLKQDGAKNTTRDGMDAAVCTLDLTTNKLYYAGANRPLWIVENEELKEIKATKVAVAGFTPDDQVYQEHVININTNQKFYMTSDGYADQFGGERNKKYKVKRMKDFIVENAYLSFGEQQKKLENELFEWMKGYEQVDDVCVIGFQLSTVTSRKDL